MPEAFALVREASRRILGERHFDVQILGGVVLHENKIAEMKTGEGKTLTIVLAAYLNALDNLTVAMKENGHDVTMQVFMADTGRWAGLFMVSLSASDGATLGAAMDDRTEPWFTEILTSLEGSREYVHGFALQCETYYSRPQE